MKVLTLKRVISLAIMFLLVGCGLTQSHPLLTELPIQLSEGMIVFYSNRDGNPEIYTMNADGSDQRRLTSNQFEDSSPSWSPNGSQIVFVSDRDDPNPKRCFPNCFYQLYLMNVDGSDEHKLVETEFPTLHPDWHPDGTRISFDSEFNLQGDIYVVNADGSGLQLLIEDGFWADWSPDGSKIVFASRRDGSIEIYIADSDGGDQKRLTENLKFEVFPAWSPDGQRIAFVIFEQRQIFVMDIDGSNEQQLTYRGDNENPDWSPDGTRLIFQSTRDGNFEIYTLIVEEALQGSEGPGLMRLTQNQAGDLWPAWGITSIHESEVESFMEQPFWTVGVLKILAQYGCLK